jgi:hypothetical protein
MTNTRPRGLRIWYRTVQNRKKEDQSTERHSVFIKFRSKKLQMLVGDLQCKEDTNYVFPGIKLRGLVHTTVSDLNIPRIGPPISPADK